MACNVIKLGQMAIFYKTSQIVIIVIAYKVTSTKSQQHTIFSPLSPKCYPAMQRVLVSYVKVLNSKIPSCDPTHWRWRKLCLCFLNYWSFLHEKPLEFLETASLIIPMHHWQLIKLWLILLFFLYDATKQSPLLKNTKEDNIFSDWSICSSSWDSLS